MPGGMEIVLLIPFLILFTVVPTVIWIWALVECLTKEPSEGNEKIVWALVIVFTGLIGGILYFLIRRPQRKREIGI